jgi:hypothetical protein
MFVFLKIPQHLSQRTDKNTVSTRGLPLGILTKDFHHKFIKCPALPLFSDRSEDYEHFISK